MATPSVREREIEQGDGFKGVSSFFCPSLFRVQLEGSLRLPSLPRSHCQRMAEISLMVSGRDTCVKPLSGGKAFDLELAEG